MEWYLVAALAFGGMLFLLALGLPIGFSLGIAGLIGLLTVRGTVTLGSIPSILHDSVNNFVFIALPLFILLSALIEGAGFSGDIYAAGERWVGRLPGGVGVATVLAMAWFGAVSGSTIATAASMGRVGLPQMIRLGYSKPLAAGIIIGASIGNLIPPSIAMIIYGMLTDTSVGHLFMAGYGPGALLVAIFSIYVILTGVLNPQVAPRAPSYPWRERFVSLKGVVPFLVIMLMISGSIYTGTATPTEAAATACLIAIIVALAYRRFSVKVLSSALLETVAITGFIVLLMVGGKIFSFFLSIAGVPQGLTSLLVGLFPSPIMLVAALMALYLILGALMDPLSMQIITIPLFFPVLRQMGVDPVLFGILVIIQVELAVVTPPVGMELYVIAAMGEPYGVTLGDCIRGMLPFVFMMLLGIAIIVAFPSIALWLPSTMFSR